MADENQPTDMRVKKILQDWHNLTEQEKEAFVVEGPLKDLPWDSLREMLDRVDQETKQRILDRIDQETKLNLLNRLFEHLLGGQSELGEMIVFTWLNHLPYSSQNNIFSGLIKDMGPVAINFFRELAENLHPVEMVKAVVALTADLPAPDKEHLIYQLLRSLPAEARVGVLHRLLRSLPAEAKVESEDATDTTDHCVDVPISKQASMEVHVTEQASEEVKRLLRREDTDLATLLTQALAFEKWYRDVRADGNRLLVERGRGDFHEVNRP